MSDNFDHLSIEELQAQLHEIQRRIVEKEKQQIIEKISDLLKTREPAYVKSVLAFVEGKKIPDIRDQTPAAGAPPREEEKAKKEGAYLRNGKVFFGIQEIKFTKYDKNQVLRISKEGKGLPPRVDAFPDEIRDALLTLPVRSETTPPPSLSDMDTVVDERCQPGSTASEPEPVRDELAEPLVDARPDVVAEVDTEPVGEAQPDPIAKVSPDAVSPIEPAIEPVAHVTEPATVFLEVPLDADEGETQTALPEPPTAAPPATPPRTGRKSAASKSDATPRIKPEPLQASLF
jgi:hypothetical protein